MMRALPHVATLEALTQLEQEFDSGGSAYCRGDLAVTLMVPTSGLASAVYRYCQGMEGGCSAADATAATEALWQLHATLCRSIHASSAGLTVAHPNLDMLLSPLAHCLLAFSHVQAAQQGTAANSDTDVSDSEPRHLLAMSVAQAEAVLVAAAIQPPPADELLASTLLIVITSEQATLAFSPAVQQLLDALIERLQASEAFCSTGKHRAFLTALLRHQQLRREPQLGDALELAQAAATRSCAYLRCANLASEGGPAAGQGAGSQRCSKCKVAWYCGTACSHADWRAGHRRVCRALGAAREAAEVAV
ncbi:hypothetical protein D9Q98_003715 [Chlorella vulgaris]|uniref:MYND-type domain-containing protein n=1 Tax=Chlorella vulgaris TaxID=3077 RepID=A0A9D4TTQ8_CHLVU|nr:hypothetical protein D9Q98_003715 [Chlorella vulgaris]